MKGLNIIRKYEEDYRQTMDKAGEFLPKEVLPDFPTSVQQIVIYDCTDGYLILRYSKREGSKFIITRRSSINWQELLHQQKLYDEYGRESTQRFTLKIKEPTKFKGHFISISRPLIMLRGGLKLRPKYLSATIVVGEPGEDLSHGDEDAKNDIRTFLSATNLGVSVVQEIEDTRDRVIKELEGLLARYRQCITGAKDEEDVQQFLKENPFILNPWGTIHPKYKLGKEYVCDFLIEDPLAPDFKHIFVEIEPAATELFHKSEKRETEFRAEVHHALNQLSNWEIWIRKNIAYLRQDFQEFDQASFILVIGRDANLSQAQRKVLMDENARARNRTILTYDDLTNRLEGMINSLRELISSTAKQALS